MVNAYSYFKIKNVNKFSHFISVATLLTPENKYQEAVIIVLYLINFINVLFLNNSLYIRYGLEKVTKIFSPNRDVVLFSFSISLNITCLI